MSDQIREFLASSFGNAICFKSSDLKITYFCTYDDFIIMFGEVIRNGIENGLGTDQLIEEIKVHDQVMGYGWSNILQTSTDQNGNIM